MTQDIEYAAVLLVFGFFIGVGINLGKMFVDGMRRWVGKTDAR